MGPLWAVMPEGVSAVLALKAGPLRAAPAMRLAWAFGPF